MSNSPLDLILITLKDTWKRKNLALIIFLIISLAVLGVSWKWPRIYVSTSIIEVDDQNILTPLLEGSAVTTSIKDQAKNAQQLIYSKRALNQVIKVLSPETDNLSDKEKDDLWESVRDSSEVKNVGSNLIKITYRSKDPIKAQLLASSLTNFVITESIEGKRLESEGAYRFISDQADEYHKKLLDSEQALKEFRSDNLGADPASSAVVNARILELQRSIEQSNLALNESKIRMENIDAQLSGEAEVSSHLTREGQLQERINVLQANLDTLKMTYLDSYPDVIIVKDQIKSLKESMLNIEYGDPIGLVQSGALNPLFQELRAKKSQFTTELAALQTRISETNQLLIKEKSRARQINNAVAMHAQLTRDYDGNKILYEKLLKKRENARVSMNVDIANQGMTLKIKEIAAIPVKPVGVRFIHFAIVGLFGAFGAPFGIAFVLVAIDGNYRTVSSLKGFKGLPVLGEFLVYRNTREKILNVVWVFYAAIIVGSVVSLYGYIGWLKMTGQA